jgi:hypothetical protein
MLQLCPLTEVRRAEVDIGGQRSRALRSYTKINGDKHESLLLQRSNHDHYIPSRIPRIL